MDEVRSGSSYISQSDLRVHFGLGAAEKADLEIHWPSGVVDKIPGVKANQVVTVKRGQHEAAGLGYDCSTVVPLPLFSQYRRHSVIGGCSRPNRLLAAAILLFAGLAMGHAEQPCARCHPAEVAAFERSPMGRSVGAPSVSDGGRIVHKLSGSTITISRQRRVLNEHRLEQRGVVAEYPVAYSVGAGIVGYSYIVRLGQYLFQSPVSYYTQTKSWDLTPGYETEPHLDFTHQISSGCLFCHTGSVNRWGD